MRLTVSLFLVFGLALLGGSGAWYYYGVQRPLTWPTAEAAVVSSRVVNPTNPNQHSPELVLRLASGASTRDVTLTAGWSSGSYDMVRSVVDRYPAGARITVAINPADANDVRYELGPTFTNLIGPGVLGIMGVIFAAIGLVTLARARRPAPSAADNPRLLRRVAWTFAGIGAAIVALGIWLVWLDVNMLRTWVPIEAESVAVQPITISSTGNRRSSSPLYDVQVTFRFETGGRRFESQTTSGLSTSSRSRRDALLAQFAPGTRHRIHHRPDDANVIRYNLGWSFTTFALSLGMVLMGLVFLGFGTLFLRFPMSPGTEGPPDIDAEDRQLEREQRFRRR